MSDVAVIGTACRFPGDANSPSRYWDLLLKGRDAVTEIPKDRWEHRNFLGPADADGKTYTFRAGTLGDVSGFDAGFFGISPREAEQMDPQQRLLLELTWEALERGGQVPEHLSGSDCAVYVGISSTDYADLRQSDPASVNAYFMLGSTLSIAANRISHVFDLHGPSMAIDTACSSGLVALYEAVHAVREGRAGMAVVGAVNLLLSPFPFIGFSKASMLSPYGQCRAFDKVAKGYVRAEGGGVLIIKPLADAERDGDPILAVIRGIGINTNGRTQGVSLPSSERQEELLRQIYAECGADPDDLVYVEAHGTGTAVGDPAEAAAIGRALAQRRAAKQPLPIGSAKSNLGHMEPASGMAGIIKAIEILRHGMIPPSLHVDEPNPAIDLAGLRLAVATRPQPVRATERPALVGVNSFGFGGSNAHVVIQEYRKAPPPAAAPCDVRPPLMLSARAPAALAEMAGALADSIDAGDVSRYDLAWTLARRRSHHPHRATFRAAIDAALGAELRAFAAGKAAAGTVSGKALPSRARVGFVYSGNGAQWLGMGVRLLAEDPVFRGEVERIDALIQIRAGWSVVEELNAPAETSRIADTRFSQPMLFAVQAGLTRALAARGLVPEAVTGHSVGEVAAAYASGVLDLEAAVQVILCRSEIQGRTRGMGRMAAVSIAPERVATLLAPYDGAVELAAFNSPNAVTLSGAESALLNLKDRLAKEGIDVRMLDLDYAFHNKVLEPLQDDLMVSLGTVPAVSSACRTYSTVTGGELDGQAMDASYWWRNVRQPVRFRHAIEAMAADGVTILVEIGPHPIIQSYIRQTLRGQETPAHPLSTISRQNSSADRLNRAVDDAWVLGARLDWDLVFPVPGRHVELPTYPWQRERHWFPVTPEARGPAYSRWEGPLLGWRPAAGMPLWEMVLDSQSMPFLADHQVGGAVVFPAAGFVEMALEASRQLFGQSRHDIEQMEIRRPLVLDRAKAVRFSWNAEQAVFQILSRTVMADEPWSLHVTGRLTKATHEDTPEQPRFSPSTAARKVGAGEHYAFADSIGLSYGPAFRTVHEVTVEGRECQARLTHPQPTDFELDPRVFDGCLQALFNILRERIEGAQRTYAFLPSQFGRLVVYRDALPAACHIRLERISLRSVVATFTLVDTDGIVVAEARACRFQRMELGRAAQPPARYGFEVVALASDGPERLAAIAPTPRTAAVADPLDAVAAAFAAEAMPAVATCADSRRDLAQVVARLAADADGRPAADAWRTAIAAHPDRLAELTMLGRAGLRLPDLLAGGDAAAALPSPATLDHFLDASPSFAALHDAVAEAVAAAVSSWPSHRRLRVIEVGGGAPGLTTRLLSLLPRDAFHYTVAVTDPDAILAVEANFGALPHVDVALLDPTVPIADQPGVSVHGHDLIIAANALGAWADDASGLAALARLGAGGAVVIAGAATTLGWLGLAAAVHTAAGRGFAARPLAELATAAATAGLVNARVVPIENSSVLTATVTAPPVATVPAAALDMPWLILAGAQGHERAMAEALAEDLGSAVIVHPQGIGETEGAVAIDVADPAAWRDLMLSLKEAESEPAGLIHLLGLADDAETPEALMALQDRRCWSALAFAQGLPEASQSGPRLVIVTAGALNAAPSQAPLWGLGRVLRNELPQMAVRQIDLTGDLPALAAPLAREILKACHEDEVLLGADRRLGLRLRRQHEAQSTAGDGETLSFAAGSLDHLTWVPATRRAPDTGEIEIAVKATGLNFRDVMLALGILPDEAVENGFAGATVGMEAAGVVSRVGDGAGDFKVGDEVLFFASACFSSHVTTRITAVARKPAGMDFATAATIPTTFFTIFYALRELARLQPGERVLIHGAAGGVGLAAIQYCRHVGAEIYATAGTPEKRDMVRLAGVAPERILDSRTLEFADRILEITGGQGVDVVLNSLAGEAIHKSLMVLRPFGRFLELGKRDFFANTPLGLRPFRNNISYFGIDADQLMAVKPQLTSRLFGEMMELFERGVFSPLPFRVFPRERIVEAFRHMQQSRHIGKIIVAGHAEQEATPDAKAGTLALDPEAAYLVTGGLGGFGLSTALWLADKGARHLVLASRRGAATDEARAGITALEARGVTVDAVACDVTEPTQVAAMVSSVRRPLKGIIHAAAVFDDGIATNMGRAQFARVLAPKVVGAWALHQATLELPLDFFVLYSSVTTILGNPGQANYVAANLYLETLAHHRRALGLPALAVGWGAIADAGYLTRNTDVRDSLSKRMGVEALTTETALARLETLLAAREPAVTVVAQIDWRPLGTGLPALKSPRFAEVAGGGRAEATVSPTDLTSILADLSPAEVREVLIEMVAGQVGNVLRIPPDRLDMETSIFDMGMDSLMALELRMAIEENFGIELPAMVISEGASITRLAERIREHLIGGSGETAESSDMVAEVLTRHAENIDVAAVTRELREGTGASA